MKIDRRKVERLDAERVDRRGKPRTASDYLNYLKINRRIGGRRDIPRGANKFLDEGGAPRGEKAFLAALKSSDRIVGYDEVTVDGDVITVFTSYHGTSSAFKTAISSSDESNPLHNVASATDSRAKAIEKHASVVSALNGGPI